MRAGRSGAAAAILGGLAALAGTALLPVHEGGGLGEWIAGLFLVAGLALALASLDLASRGVGTAGGRSRLRSWAALGAAGFTVGGAGLVADVIERPILAAEVAGVIAVAAWWVTAGRALRRGSAFGLGTFSLIVAALAVAALGLQLAWSAPTGAVPARFAYTLWGPWGLWLGAVVSRHDAPFGPR